MSKPAPAPRDPPRESTILQRLFDGKARRQPVAVLAVTSSVSRADARSDQRSRSARWSPTRNALAMIVSAGFTAADEGKKLASTT
jgi:hypothetical protein